MEQNKNIPQGYKDSPLGIIPQEWEVKRLGDIANIDEKSLNSQTLNDYEFDYISLSDVDSEDFKIETTKQIFKTAPSRARRIVTKGDILMSTVRPNLQGFSIIKNEVENLIASTGFAVISPFKGVSEYLFMVIFSQSISRQFHQLLVGSNYPAINSKDVKRLKILSPPLPEQQKIAEILTCWDAAIEKQTQLIEKLETRKRGLMQQLLTGKKRLKGFEGEWQIVELRSLFDEVVESNNNQTHEIMTISAKLGLISQKEKFDRIIAGDSLKKYTLLKEGDFAYNKGNSNLYEMGCIYQLEKIKSALVPFVYICFRPTNKCFSTFYKHWFQNHGLDRQLKRIITSGARGDGLLNVNNKDFFSLLLPYPSLAEQTAIANILSAADDEIGKEKGKLAALRSQKKGLMQVLLTGKKRVKI